MTSKLEKNQASIQSIAVLRLSALGDICMTIPLILSLKKNFPNATIYWIISEKLSSLVNNIPGVHFIEVDKPKTIKQFFKCYQQLKSYHFDVLLSPQTSFRSNLISLFIRADIKYGYGKLHSRDLQRFFIDKTVPTKAEHLVDSFMRFAEVLGAPHEKPEWELPIKPEDQAWATSHIKQLQHPIITVCPTASNAERNWCTQRYINVLNHLKDHWGGSVVLVGDTHPLSITAGKLIEQGINQPCINLIGKTNLQQLAAIISYSDILIAPDTGPAHIADATGTPVIGLYAVAPAEKTGPYNSIKYTINKFPEAVKHILKKDIKNISWRQRVHHHDAMLLIEEKDVIDQCNSILSTLQKNNSFINHE